MNPLVSVVIPVYNRPQLLLESVTSVLDQTYKYFEILIVDDGSLDETALIVDKLSSQYPTIVRSFHQPNLGPGPARQLGLQQSRGDYIQYLDSDDLLLPRKFEVQVEALETNPNAQICYGKSYQEDHSTNPVTREGPIRSTGSKHAQLFPLLLLERWWTTSCPLYRKSLLDRIGPWLPLKNEEDWEYDARAGALRAPLVFVPNEVSVRRIHISKDHLSSAGTTDIQKLVHRSIAQQSIFRSALSAGVCIGSAEMKRFSRSSFLLARQCGLAGASMASKEMFILARQALPLKSRWNLEFISYSILAFIFGWKTASRITISIVSLIKNRSSVHG